MEGIVVFGGITSSANSEPLPRFMLAQADRVIKPRSAPGCHNSVSKTQVSLVLIKDCTVEANGEADEKNAPILETKPLQFDYLS